MGAAFSIKRRIVLAVVTAELLLFACLVLFAGFVMRRNSIRSFDTALHGRAMAMTSLVRYSEGAHPELFFDNSLLPHSLSGTAPDLFRIETNSGRVLGASASTPVSQKNDLKTSWEFSLLGTPYRALRLTHVPVLDTEDGIPANAETLNVVYASSTREMNRDLLRAFSSIFAAGIFLLGISVYISVRAIETGLRPVADLASSASAISASDWKLKVTDSAVNVVEIAPLTQAMSQMLETLHEAFQQQR